MRTLVRVLLGLLGLIALVVLIGPFLVPIRPLQGTVPPEQLAEPDSRFIDVGGLTIHAKVAAGGEPAIVLLHGFAASTFSWRAVMAPLAELGTVVAYDRPSSGLTERPLPGDWSGESPYSPFSQVEQVIGLMDALDIERAVLVGNSAGGSIATLVALRHPERVQGLVLVDAAIYAGGGAPGWIRPFLHTPQMDRLGVLIARAFVDTGQRMLETAWHDPSQITPEVLAGYRKPLQVDNWDRGLWELTKASQDLDLDQRLAEIRTPTLVITGDDDRIVPTEQSVRLAAELPGARLVVIPNCGHVPQEECPEAFLAAVEEFLAGL